jgi:hypothetical protein
MPTAPSLASGLAILATFIISLAPWTYTDRTGSDLVSAKAITGGTAHTFEFRDESDAALTEWALGQFAQAGLRLPPLVVAFHDSKEPCGGHPGVFRSGTPARIDMCGFNWDRFIVKAKMTLLHELGHAWADHSLTAEARQRFVDSRALPTWGDDQWPWKEQGSEQAAETFAWALLDEEHRMSSIPDSQARTLAEAYLQLTGTLPSLRVVGVLSGLIHSA